MDKTTRVLAKITAYVFSIVLVLVSNKLPHMETDWGNASGALSWLAGACATWAVMK